MTKDELRDFLWDKSYIIACERDSPNSPDFERARDEIYEQLLEEYADELY